MRHRVRLHDRKVREIEVFDPNRELLGEIYQQQNAVFDF